MQKISSLILCLCVLSLAAQDPEVYTSRDVDQFPFIRSMVCESPGSKLCFEEQIRTHISNSIQFPQKAQEQKLSGKVYVQFTIDKNGQVKDIKTRARHSMFSVEAERITKLIPELKPAMKGGKAVAMSYTFPLDFSLEEEEPGVVEIYEAASPPEVAGCKEDQDPPTCFEKKISEHLTRAITTHPVNRKYKRDKTYQIYVRYYAEITAAGEVSNIVAVSNEEVIQDLVKSYLSDELEIKGPARNENGEAIPVSFVNELRMRAERQYETRGRRN